MPPLTHSGAEPLGSSRNEDKAGRAVSGNPKKIYRMIICEVTIEDVYELQKISKQTFEETFSHSNTEENLKQYLRENLSVDKLIKELSNSNSLFYFAIDNNHICGYLKLNLGKAQTEINDDKGLEIERIYVLKEYLGKK